jgi:menaquinone-9 beta-reductase
VSPDVVIVGAGPAGATAALVLARAGARVTLIDRARFPRDKLCGDTLNPGTLRCLARLGLEPELTAGGMRLDGMRLTGPSGASVEGRYPAGLAGVALPRREFDDRLVRAAVAAGAALEEGLTAERLLVDARGGSGTSATITGVRTRTAAGSAAWRAPVTIVADGRPSALASTLGLTRRPHTLRWAIGAHFDSVTGLSTLGEMHVRADHYIGVAPLPRGQANAILVAARARLDSRNVPLREVLGHALANDRELASRFAGARASCDPSILGPMAVDVRPPDGEGLLLAGDAAGFVDPMTGDGMRFAIAGGEMAAHAALDALAGGWNGVHRRHAAARRQAFGRKRAFNEVMRRLTASPAAVLALDTCAPLLSPLFSRVIRYAGDVHA